MEEEASGFDWRTERCPFCDRIMDISEIDDHISVVHE
jgi:hypothetical protein